MNFLIKNYIVVVWLFYTSDLKSFVLLMLNPVDSCSALGCNQTTSVVVL